MVTITKVRATHYNQQFEIVRQGKAFYSREHINIHRFMAAMPETVRQSVAVPKFAWAIMAGPFLQVVPAGREGAFKVTIAYHTADKKRLYTRAYPKCHGCGRHNCDKTKLVCK